MVRVPHSHCQGSGFNTGQRTKIPQVVRRGQGEKKKARIGKESWLGTKVLAILFSVTFHN